MESVKFEVKAIKEAYKPNCVVVNVVFKATKKPYEYIRKNYGNYTIIDGCKVYFDGDYNFIKSEREYDTKGVKKHNTTNNGGKTSSKIKNEIIKKNIVVKPVEPIKTKVKLTKDGEIHHELYEEIKTCIECKIPLYLAGPAGSGKNHTIEQIAKELDYNFYFANAVQQEYKLTGFIDAGGTYHETEFYKACKDESDCIFFLDEMDASIPEVLVLLNAAIANGYFEFPNGTVTIENVHFMSAGNTFGAGADDMYTGRMVLDSATLDRFGFMAFDYCLAIEMHISSNNVELVEFVRQLRKETTARGIRATFSYRCITMLTKLEKTNMSIDMAMKIAIIKGMDKDTLNTLNIQGTTKYHKALRDLRMAA